MRLKNNMLFSSLNISFVVAICFFVNIVFGGKLSHEEINKIKIFLQYYDNETIDPFPSKPIKVMIAVKDTDEPLEDGYGNVCQTVRIKRNMYKENVPQSIQALPWVQLFNETDGQPSRKPIQLIRSDDTVFVKCTLPDCDSNDFYLITTITWMPDDPSDYRFFFYNQRQQTGQCYIFEDEQHTKDDIYPGATLYEIKYAFDDINWVDHSDLPLRLQNLNYSEIDLPTKRPKQLHGPLLTSYQQMQIEAFLKYYDYTIELPPKKPIKVSITIKNTNTPLKDIRGNVYKTVTMKRNRNFGSCKPQIWIISELQLLPWVRLFPVENNRTQETPIQLINDNDLSDIVLVPCDKDPILVIK